MRAARAERAVRAARAERVGEQRVVSELRVRVQRQVVCHERDARVEQDLQPALQQRVYRRDA